MKLLIKNLEMRRDGFEHRRYVVEVSPKDLAQKVSDAISGDERLGKENKEVHPLADLLAEVAESVGDDLLEIEGCVSPDKAKKEKR